MSASGVGTNGARAGGEATTTTRARHGVLRAYLRAPSGVGSAVGGIALLLLAILGPVIWGEAATTPHPDQAWLAPSSAHWLGTDDLGRDVLARVLAATRTTLELSFAASAIGAAGGTVLGAAVTLLPPRGRRVGMRTIDLLMAFPPIIVAIMVVAIVGAGQTGAIVGIGIALIPSFARLAATTAASVGGRDFVAAATVLGVPRRRLLTRYVLLNGSDTLVVTTSVAVASSIVAISSLSFLSMGVQPPSYDWGQMLTTGIRGMYANWGAATGPGVAIVLAGLWASSFGEAWARALNPLLWTARRRRGVARASARTAHVAAAPPAAASSPAAARAAAAPAAALSSASASPPAADEVLHVRDLRVRFPSAAGNVEAVAGVSLTIRRGDVVGLVGESGCGKSSVALALAAASSSSARVTHDALRFEGTSLDGLGGAVRRRALVRLAMVFQDPMSSLNPSLRIGTQLTEAVVVHQGGGRSAARMAAVERLEEVGIPRARECLGRYPHELSGGMRQRVMIAMGLMTDPALLIADEPTTALDVRVQRDILQLLSRLNRERGLAIVLISHDLGVVTEICQRVDVLYAGRVVEELSAERLAAGGAEHPYTRALVETLPELDTDLDRPLATIPGTPPRLAADAAGCPFAPRCASAEERCRADRPPLAASDSRAAVACWVAQERQAQAAGR